MEAAQVKEYLAHIGIQRDELAVLPKDSLDLLKLLVRNHQLHVPFENLAVCGVFPVDPLHVESPLERISINSDKIYQKIAVDHRGGYCFELNSIFADLLRAFGYKVEFLSARVVGRTSDDSTTYPLTALSHIILLVTLHDSDARYLCDVGFGGRGQPREPLPLVEGVRVKTESSEVYELRRVGIERVPSTRSTTGQFQISIEAPQIVDESTNWAVYYSTHGVESTYYPSYVFSTVHTMAYADYSNANWCCSTHPESIFTKAPLCVARTPLGIKILHGSSYKHMEQGQIVDERTIDQDKLIEFLKEVFHLVPATRST